VPWWCMTVGLDWNMRASESSFVIRKVTLISASTRRPAEGSSLKEGGK
jgi:hypothetical protein